MPEVHRIKKNDLGPALTADLKNADNTAADLTGATVTFDMRLVGSSTVKINGASAEVVGTPTDGKVKYQWVTGDTDEVGEFDGKFEVTVAAVNQSYPTKGFFRVIVEDNF